MPPTRSIAAAAAVLSAMGLGACTAMGDEQEAVATTLSNDQQCFFTRQIDGYSEAPDGPRGEDRLYVRAGVNQRWLLEALPGCPDLNWSNRIALDTRGFTSLCTGHTVDLIAPSGIPHSTDRCTARVIGLVSEPPR